MNYFVLRDETSGAALGAVAKAETGWQRLVGLLGSRCIPPHEGMWFDDCSAVHTIGMRFALDIIFLDRNGRVIDLRERVAPNALAVVCPRACVTVELGAGTLATTGVRLGDRLVLEASESPA
ncbi:MAG TPA: DUF192 domain-containing protein [Candidatus Baltobacteraceae bacterium]|nr:DUF192 domain-containing protein [Candidatus Baltobacteraceae bacterium]